MPQPPYRRWRVTTFTLSVVLGSFAILFVVLVLGGVVVGLS